MNSCRTLTSQSLDGPVAGASSRPWLHDTLWMYRADRPRWFGYIPKKRQRRSKNGVFGPWNCCGWVTWTPFGFPKVSPYKVWSNFCHSLVKEIQPVLHQVFKLCNSLFISLPGADLVFMPGGCKSMVRF